ncbi:thiamine ABC transporter ATP-binding protein [Aurantimonas sp. HBX-1]|uniref:thiamine ABC transporter ATP-binding protein n=1 Tax=Aurantimonas sp. HBX-1 TaxID=2906072 RepID=UPI001F28858B|nr:thiamine ABC transporter ATP-binding protein [Aurantimonas sp. HBX-1]UIJ72374.1 thiamine ABC transporter ATP-binding protein [Aurantimonas sp. HBX-1]
MSAPPALALQGIRFAYEAMAMRFDLAVEAGEWLALIGPSGAGKSTLLDIAAGFAEPDAGRVLMGGADVTARPPSERPLSILFQDNNLFPHLDVFRNVALGIAPGLRVSRADRVRVAAALDAVGLAGFETRRPAEMSGGERQRVALARAFLRDRPLLLLDEPFAALGPALRRDMLDLLQRLRAERQGGPTTVVMVTHHPEDAVGHADRVAFMEAGEIIAVGPTRAVLTGQGDPRVAAYLGTAKPVP